MMAPHPAKRILIVEDREVDVKLLRDLVPGHASHPCNLSDTGFA
jgi:hypothetical protein